MPAGFNLPAQPAMKIEAAKSASFRRTVAARLCRLGNVRRRRSTDTRGSREARSEEADQTVATRSPSAASCRRAASKTSYVVEGEEGAIAARSRRGTSHEFPVDPVVRVVKSDGTLVIRLDDIGRGDLDVDGVASFTADGEYQIDRRRPERRGRPAISFICWKFARRRPISASAPRPPNSSARSASRWKFRLRSTVRRVRRPISPFGLDGVAERRRGAGRLGEQRGRSQRR